MDLRLQGVEKFKDSAFLMLKTGNFSDLFVF